MPSHRIMKLGSMYGKRFLNRQVMKKFGLPQEQRLKEWPIVSGDVVQVIEGPEKGKTGQVLAVKRKTNQIVVKDVNMHIRTKVVSPIRAGYFFKTETPLHYSNVQLVDPIKHVPTKIKMGKDQNGNNVRYSTLTGAVIPKLRVQYTVRNRDAINKCLDTPADTVWKVTFKPFTNVKPPKSQRNEAANIRAEAEKKYLAFKRTRVPYPIQQY